MKNRLDWTSPEDKRHNKIDIESRFYHDIERVIIAYGNQKDGLTFNGAIAVLDRHLFKLNASAMQASARPPQEEDDEDWQAGAVE